MKKELFQKMSSWSQLFFLLLFIFLGLVVAGLIVTIITKISPESILSANVNRILVAVQSFLIILLPAYLCAYLFHKNANKYLKINKIPDLKTLILSIVVIIIIQPFIVLSGYLNEKIQLPTSMAAIEHKMVLWEELAKRSTEMLLTTNSIGILIVNLLIIGVLAGVAEEFLFRGCLQQIIRRITHNKHVSIWITAFIFSFIHLQFYGFIPRFLLGALLGYLYVWSSNLWVPITIHAVNNMIGVLTFHFLHGSTTFSKLDNLGGGSTWWIGVISLLLSMSLLFIIIKDSRNKHLDEFTTL